MTPRQPIAIVGAACRFPGASSLDEYQDLLRSGGTALTIRAADGRGADRAGAGGGAARDARTVCGGFLAAIDTFDAPFFKISEEEAAELDPQQRLVLETAWQALESAALPAACRRGLSVGTFIGITGSEYGAVMARSPRSVGPFSGTGTLSGMAAGRLSYALDLHGPCLAVDTACSSSLAAVHLACQSLAADECDVAVAGGVNALIDPVAHEYLRAIGALSPTGVCRVFDDKADGYVRGEGCGIVVLRRLADACAARHCIVAVIRGFAMNHDGKSNGLTAPNGLAQAAVIRDAITRAGIRAAEVDYLEAHGTGTRLGDPVELRAIGEAYGSGERPMDRPLLVGSVKANIGHLEAAAGIASVIKVALALRHRRIPPQINVENVNTLAPWRELSLDVCREGRAWPGDAPAYAAVSSFGFTGTNVHLILEEHVAAARAPAEVDSAVPILLSGRSAQRVRDLAGELVCALTALDTWSLPDVAYTLFAGRAHLGWRAAFAASSREQLIVGLNEIAAGQREIVDCSRRGEAWPGPTAGSDDCGRYLDGASLESVPAFDRSSRRAVLLPVPRLEPRPYWFEPPGGSERMNAADYLSLIMAAVAARLTRQPLSVTSFRLLPGVSTTQRFSSGLDVQLRTLAPNRLRVDVVDVARNDRHAPVLVATANVVTDRHGL